MERVAARTCPRIPDASAVASAPCASSRASCAARLDSLSAKASWRNCAAAERRPSSPSLSCSSNALAIALMLSASALVLSACRGLSSGWRLPSSMAFALARLRRRRRSVLLLVCGTSNRPCAASCSKEESSLSEQPSAKSRPHVSMRSCAGAREAATAPGGKGCVPTWSVSARSCPATCGAASRASPQAPTPAWIPHCGAASSFPNPSGSGPPRPKAISGAPNGKAAGPIGMGAPQSSAPSWADNARAGSGASATQT
mmetsp:Transcript_96586/g.273053  ORF Transcript_96586/g.273053 Transcript_96586/m.273053 type:complete len:257 (-) Transcript_96586:102-872(-)